MARKENTKESGKEKKDSSPLISAKFWNDLKQETLQAVLSIISFLLALVSILAALGKAGPVGYYMYGEHGAFTYLLGVGYFLLPVFFLMLSISFLKGIQKSFFDLPRLIGSLLFFLSGIGLIDILPGKHGGVIGYLVSTPLMKLLDVYATTLLLIAGIAIAILVMFDTHFTLLVLGTTYHYAVTADGKRFLMSTDPASGGGETQQLNVVVNWLASLKR